MPELGIAQRDIVGILDTRGNPLAERQYLGWIGDTHRAGDFIADHRLGFRRKRMLCRGDRDHHDDRRGRRIVDRLDRRRFDLLAERVALPSPPCRCCRIGEFVGGLLRHSEAPVPHAGAGDHRKEAKQNVHRKIRPAARPSSS